MRKLFLSFTLVIAVFSLSAQSIHQLSSNDYVKEYNVAGPFHQEDLHPDDFSDLLEIEFIEHESQFGPKTEHIKTILAKAAPHRRLGYSLDFNKILGDSAVAVAYAQFKVYAPEETEALFIVSAADGAKIYVGQKNVQTFLRQGQFFTSLQKGDNNVVIKVPNRDWGWNLSVRILDEEKAREYLDKADEENEYLQFLHAKLEIKTGANADPRFRPGSFPVLVFDKPLLVKKYLGGRYQIKTRWFDEELVEVQYPKKPGRYVYYAEVEGANGVKLKRSATLFCSDDWRGQFQRLGASLNYIATNEISKSTWMAHQQAIGDYAGSVIQSSAMLQKEGAVLLAFTDQMNKKQLEPDPLHTPLIVNGDYHAKLKQKILGVENSYPELKRPSVGRFSAPELKKLSISQAKEYEEMRLELIEASNKWMENGGAPFDMVVAQGGKILFHGVFGEDGYGKFTTETPTEIASITKLFTGMLFAQFVDQGLIDIDDAVGKYLPEFPLSGPNALTLRHCFTHTSGFFGHMLFDGVHNPWLENTLTQVIKEDTVGVAHQYNGMGYDLAGKVMEVVTGKSVFSLFREYLYDPLEMDNTVHDLDLGFSCQSTAYDMAKVAQLLLNKGTYGDLQFFSPETFEKIRPKDLNQFYPGVKRKWGIGINMQGMRVQDEQTGKQRFLIDDNIIGHGSATASIFWVDQKHDLIITQSRRRGDRNFGPNFQELIKVVEKHLIK